MLNLGKVAYDAYRGKSDGKSLATGQPIPEWERLPEAIRSAWHVAASAVSGALLRDIIGDRRIDFDQFISAQRDWSEQTFGPTTKYRLQNLSAHITKELAEVTANPYDLIEWIDIILLCLDGYWRHGGKPEDFARMLRAKQMVNFNRTWVVPADPTQPVEHNREDEGNGVQQE